MQTRSLALPETARHFLIIIERYLFVSDWISISNIRKYTRQMSSIIKANIIIPFLLSSDGFWAEIAITHAHLLKNLPTCKLRKNLNKYIFFSFRLFNITFQSVPAKATPGNCMENSSTGEQHKHKILRTEQGQNRPCRRTQCLFWAE